jgi:sigma-B regulation protein RsbQ
MSTRPAVEHVLERNRVTVRGVQGAPVVFLHGFGWDQSTWRLVAPHFEDRHQVVLYDITGLGRSDRTAYDFEKYSSPDGHVADLFEILDALGLERVVLVGHSAGALIALRAAVERPERVVEIALVAASPCYVSARWSAITQAGRPAWPRR